MLRTGFAARITFAGLCALVALPALPGVAGTLPGAGQTPSQHEDFKLIADDGESGDSFGIAVAIDGNTVLVGARGDDHGDITNAGSAYLFDATTGNQLAKLTADDGLNQFGDFGVSTAIDSNKAIIGTRANGAYFFDLTDPTQPVKKTRFVSSDRSSFRHEFGSQVAVSGDIAIVTAPGKSNSASEGPSFGRAYIYDLTRPARTIELAKIDGPHSSSFGSSVAIDGNLALIGAQGDDTLGFNTNVGSAFLFDLTDPAHPVQLSKLIASDPGVFDRFGSSVAIEGNVAIVGTEISGGPGRAYLFDITDPTHPIEVAKLTASDGFRQDLFGGSVAIDGNMVIIGAKLDDDHGPRSGSAYLFDIADLNNIVEIAKLTASDGVKFRRFGTSVGISGNTAVIGTLGISAYVFTVPEPTAVIALLLILGCPALRHRPMRQA